MKTVIASALVALSFAVPAAADVSDAKAFFALSNDSAAERIVGDTSTGNPVGAAEVLALTNDSPAENIVNFDRARNVDVSAIQAMFALTNDSPAEN
ncbi:hypothetical protein [uncultured Litoreibacter sp.]|uniref:hypothetical protein n=1 Tax=uncultured Litoreibacter sp. TaxID=1392394 RepID=UPI00260A7723|nr:hypothetical protein [uncultured Litoreibacter sp.]